MGKRLRNAFNTLQRNIYAAWCLAGNARSRMRLCNDIWAVKLLRIPLVDRLFGNSRRTICLANGVVITYRLNRGDIQSIREVFLDKAYRLPMPLDIKVLVDCGANIGLTSIWYHRQYKVNKVIAVEPDPDNAALVRLNFLQNSINGHVIEGAVGSVDGFGVFRRCKDSNVGHLVQEPAAVGEEIRVPVVSMQTVLASLAEDESVDLLKLDIEGGEQDLLTGNLGWLQRVRAIIAEFHPPLVDYHVLTGLIATRGFHYIAANTVSGNMDSFVRAASIAESDSFTGK